MGLDDAVGVCPGHVWVLSWVLVVDGRLACVDVCTVCGTVA